MRQGKELEITVVLQPLFCMMFFFLLKAGIDLISFLLLRQWSLDLNDIKEPSS